MAAAMSEVEMIPRMPIVVILGATGSGKSKLAIEIARIFKGEIVSADSMQLYKGLDVITNKVTAEERRMVPHHMLDFLEPHVNLNVVDYRNMALKKIEELIGKGSLPLVVGGTNYYIESLLWKVLVAGEVHKLSDLEGEEDKGVRAEGDPGTDSPPLPLPSEDDLTVSSSELHRRLTEVDPEMAKALHPNNRRKIHRSLQVYEQMGRPHSEVLREQREVEGGGSLGGPLRYPNSCIFWLRCEPEVLDKRLDDRVDDMLKAGLIDELLDFHRRYNAHRLQARPNCPPDYTKGIFQSIGFKEFHEYLMKIGEKQEVVGVKVEDEAKVEGEVGDKEKKKDEADSEIEKLFREGVEMLKLATRRYARKQVRWITNRFLRRPDRQVPPVYGLDATDPSQWDKLVLEPASEVVKALIAGEKSTRLEPLPVVSREDVGIEWDGEPKKCETCDRLFVDPHQWHVHLTSKKHKRALEKRKREAGQLKETDVESKRTKIE